jgi:cell division transport system permease protein
MADRRARRAALLRPPGFDDLGVKRAMADRLLPALVAAMAFLAALAAAGFVATGAVAHHWQEGAVASVTVQVPRPGEPARVGRVETRRDAVLDILRAAPGLASVRPLTDAELSDLLRPWLGSSAESLSLPLPAVIAVHLRGAGPALGVLAARLNAAAPGTFVERHDVWARRVQVLARSLEACTGLALLVVALVAGLVVAVATRAGLAARREAIEVAHNLGASDGYIATRFARRATALAVLGAAGGALASVPLLMGLTALAAPFQNVDAAAGGLAEPPALGAIAALPTPLWSALLALPVGAGVIGWVVAHITVRRWLRRLP